MRKLLLVFLASLPTFAQHPTKQCKKCDTINGCFDTTQTGYNTCSFNQQTNTCTLSGDCEPAGSPALEGQPACKQTKINYATNHPWTVAPGLAEKIAIATDPLHGSAVASIQSFIKENPVRYSKITVLTKTLRGDMSATYTPENHTLRIDVPVGNGTFILSRIEFGPKSWRMLQDNRELAHGDF